MIKVAFHSYQLGKRGTEDALYKYAKYNKEILGNESIIVSTSSRPTPALNLFQQSFNTILYPHVWINDGKNNVLRTELEKICEQEKVTHFYTIKGGEQDGVMPSNAKGFAHAIFRMDQPHGHVYAGISKFISDKYSSKHPYLNLISEQEHPEYIDDYRDELNIPKNALVIGRHGGEAQFSLDFVKNAIKNVIDKRQDLYFVFLNTHNFFNHNKVKYIPYVETYLGKTKFLNTCDAMIHARHDGECFGLAVTDFSIRNKPVITWKPDKIPNYHDVAHHIILQDKCIYYKDGKDVENILLGLSKVDILSKDWVIPKNVYSATVIMNKFKKMFID